MTSILLVGNPNVGKTTVFNALTGDTQRVGNWPGVTVEKKIGSFIEKNHHVCVTDLPGIYSLSTPIEEASQDMQITANTVAYDETSLIVNVIDACHLERHLYLTSQLLELGKPIIVALTMMDIAQQRGITIDTNALSLQLGCPVLALNNRERGVLELKQAITKPVKMTKCFLYQSFLSLLPQNITTILNNQTSSFERYIVCRKLEGDTLLRKDKNNTTAPDIDIVLADARYKAIHSIVQKTQKKRSDASEHLTAKLDRIVLHRFWAIPIFLGMMYLMFVLAINVGGAFQDFFDISSDAIFIKGTAWLLQQWHAPNWLIALCANGIGQGINTTITFTPVIASMFFFLSILETSGYMARAAFVVDKAMRALGLPGKAFVPMIVGFGCNVPAILAARTLDSKRDRLLTILMSPFMSCSARLAIYAVFVAAFFPTGGQNIVFSLYLIGILMAVFTGFLLRKTVLKGKTSPLILELPAYHRPTLHRLLRETSLRLRHFITRAGKLIIPVCVLLGGLNALVIHSSATYAGESILEIVGQWLTPIFAPMGLRPENWPATVGLLTGMLAKEVVIGTLNGLYANITHVTQTSLNFDFLALMKSAFQSIPDNIAELGKALVNPMDISSTSDETTQSMYGMLFHYFGGKAAAYAYLLFILLYVPCVSTMAAIRQEANQTFMWFSIIWSLMIAYGISVLFYQTATFAIHPQQSLIWLGILLSCIGLAVILIRRTSNQFGERYAVAIA